MLSGYIQPFMLLGLSLSTLFTVLGTQQATCAAQHGAVRGQILAVSGRPVPDALVSFTAPNGDQYFETSTQAGFFHAEDLPVGRYQIRVQHEQYFDGLRVRNIFVNRESTFTLKLLPRGEGITFLAEQGLSTFFDNARVRIPAGALVTKADGTAVTGEVTVFFNPINVWTEDRWTAPGSLQGRPEGSQDGDAPVPLLSFGMFQIEAFQGNEPLDLRVQNDDVPDRALMARMEIEITDSDFLPEFLRTGNESVPLWSFDQASDAWIEEPNAKGWVEAPTTEGGNYTLVAEIHHFSSWNFDVDEDFFTCATGFVTGTNGERVAGATIDYLGRYGYFWGYSESREDGSFCIQTANKYFSTFNAPITDYRASFRFESNGIETIVYSDWESFDARDANGDGV